MLVNPLVVTSVDTRFSNTPINLASYYSLDSAVARKPENRSQSSTQLLELKIRGREHLDTQTLTDTHHTEGCTLTKYSQTQR
jgi:hypothetical protein